ncbi:MAG TPA: protein kinase [Polyangiaceae bacterium]|nr:protein kinase [Polyangiaceae bacterium]
MDAPVQEGDVLAGKYRVEKVLGFGGMGVVVSAFRGDLEQRVAVKFLSQQAAERPDAAERFRREARAAAKIRSEHVARVLDVGTLETGLPYMVMEYLEGHDIAEELRQHERLPIVEAVEYILQAIEALAEAHAAGVVHRDLKPSNLFLARRADGSRRVKVLDFGISKALGGSSVEELSLTKTAALIGSPLYMAPEQMRSAKDVDIRADIWSLGAMLYEMLTGRPPYTGESIPQLCAALLHDEPVPLRQHRAEIPEGLEQAVLCCLMKNRLQRFPSVSELGRALLPFATADSRVHVDRAERVLGATDVTASGGIATPTERMTSGPVTSAAPSQLATTPAKLATTPQPEPRPIDPTINSWGHSDPAAAPNRRRGTLIAVAGGAALLATGIGLWAARSGGTAAPTNGAPAASSVLDRAKVEPKPSETTAPAVTSDPEPAPAASSAAAVIAVTPPSPAVTPAQGKPAGAPPKAPPKTLEPAKAGSPPAPSAGITDFGGRR